MAREGREQMPIFSAAKERTSKWKVLRQFGHRGARQISACVGQSCRQESKRTSQQQQQQQPTRHLSLFSVPGLHMCAGHEVALLVVRCVRAWLPSPPRVAEATLPTVRCLGGRWCRYACGRARRCHIDRTSSPGSEPASAPLYLFPHSSISSFSPFYSAFVSLVSPCSISSFFPLILVLFTFVLIFFSSFCNLLTYFSFHIVYSPDSFSLLRENTDYFQAM